LPVELRYFGQHGWTARTRVTAVDQRGYFASHTGVFFPGHDQFWVVDASLGFRLPKRRGLLSLNVDNLFDQRFQFQDMDPFNPTLMPERMAYFRFTLAFD
jgi:outer membrane receptor protein involved in Fe transport